jgi:predicted O-linked N-acetylglucosamine transferase (SPINDLY family)
MAQITISQALDLALQHHVAGRLGEAQQVYRQILSQQPSNPDALHYLGVLASQSGRNDIALDLIRRSIAIKPGWAEAHYALGNALKAMGQVKEAIAAFRQAIALKPVFPEAYLNLGVALIETGDIDGAIAAYRQAIILRSNFPEAYNNLGNALREKRDQPGAIAAFREAVAIKPDYGQAHNNLAAALQETGQLDEAIASYRRAIACNPNQADFHSNLGSAQRLNNQLDEAIDSYHRAIALNPKIPEAFYNLGIAWKEKGQSQKAVDAYRQAIAIRPLFAEAFNNIGAALYDLQRVEEAKAAYRQAIRLKPDYAEAFFNLGNALQDTSLTEAIAAYRQAIALSPSYADAHNNLGVALKENGQLDEAIAVYRRALEINPNFDQVRGNLGNALRAEGNLDGAIAAYREALRANPDNSLVHGSLLLTLQYHPGYDAPAIAEELRRWNQQHAEPLHKFIQPHTNDPAADRPLRIGYVSGDFRFHVVARNLLPLFAYHDRAAVDGPRAGQFEITCYANVQRRDEFTARFQKLADRWRNILDWSDERVAEQIREDQIDILIDLSVHTGNNRLPIFARKPAPVQVTFAGYPGSTGLTTIDYRLSDPFLDPPGMDESIYSEKTIRLPDSFWCYDPLDERDVEVNALPALSAVESPAVSAVESPAVSAVEPPASQTRPICFGSLNASCKITDDMLHLWARVMREVPGSRLLLLQTSSIDQKRVQQLSDDGIEPDRIEFVPRQVHRDYLRGYHRIDIGLDTFPYNGHTTSLDSFWMGVPVVTLIGNGAVSRAGWCQLSNLGLPELAGHTPDEFVRIAVALAKDLPRLAELRRTLRARMERSPLMDAAKFARSIESAYRRMWRTWCETRGTDLSPGRGGSL